MTEEHDLTSKMVEKLKKEFHSRKDAEIIARAIQKNGIKAASEDPTASERLHRAFSYEIKTGKPTNQRHSGRCWSFAALNTLRHKFATKYKFKDFELSQNYLFFWDRIERANMFFQKIIATADKPLHDRTVDFYLSFALNDAFRQCYQIYQELLACFHQKQLDEFFHILHTLPEDLDIAFKKSLKYLISHEHSALID